MPGTLVITTLSDGTNSTSATNCIQGSAKAWANFNGSSATTRASYAFSSITRPSTGNYTFNFTTAQPDVNYAVTIATDDPGVRQFLVSGSFTTSSFQVRSQNSGGSNADTAIVCVSVFR